MEITSLDPRAAMVGWPVFRDGHVRRFLCIWLEAQVARLGKRLETVSVDDLEKVQGQIAALRSVRVLLDELNIETQISELPKT